MSIDELAREAAAEARRQAVQRVDAGSMLEQLHRTRRTRAVASAASVIGLVAVLLLGGGLLARQYDTSGSDVTPNGRPTPSASVTAAPSDSCTDEVVTCLGDRRYRIALASPVTMTVPRNFGTDFSVPDMTWMEVYRNDLSTVGITIFENPAPVRDDDSWTRDPSAGSTARSQAIWLANRPFLAHTHLTRTVVDGRTAWRVSGALRPGAALHAWKESHSTAPTFALSTSTAGYWPGLASEYTFVDVPNSGVTVIWSWALHEHSSVLTGNQALINSLTFGP
jgi:hypothetical protein